MLASGLVGRGQENENGPTSLPPGHWRARRHRAAHGNPAHANTSKELAKVVSSSPMHGLLSDHLDLAVDTLRAAVANPVGDPAQDAVTRSALSGVLRIRAFRSGRRDLRDSPDAREAIGLLRASYDVAAARQRRAVMAAWDVGSALLTRYFQTGVREDLDAARFYLEPFRDTGANGPSRILRGRVVHLEAMVPYTMGCSASPAPSPGTWPRLTRRSRVRDGARAMAGMAPYRGADPERPGDRAAAAGGAAGTPDIKGLRDAAREMRAATGAATADEATSPVAALQAGGALATAGFAAQDQALVREAIAQLSRARDQVDPDYGERTRFTGMLGYTSARLYEMTGSADDLQERRRVAGGSRR